MPERNFRSRELVRHDQDDLGLDQLSQDLDTILQDSMRNLQSLRGHDVEPISSFIPTDDEMFGRSGEPGSLMSALDDLVDTPAGSHRTARKSRPRPQPRETTTTQSTNRTKKKPPVASITSRTWRPAGSTHRSPPPSSSQPLPVSFTARTRRKPPTSSRAKTAAATEEAKRVQLRIAGLQNALKNSGKKIVELEDELDDAQSKLQTALRKLDTMQLVSEASTQPRTDTGLVISKLREELAFARKERDSSNDQLASVKATLVKVLQRVRARKTCPHCQKTLPDITKS